ncbi:MKRN2 opposite strand protein [Episyrphus balteatus]|uniref:MKRN2 opposite strand protein n=1 Tax=Episyrphus balteatus TaxID=286459 RepID=UPI0024866352|nr:MKRN2 opposite strand protein [Episyrphus balteatus]
MLSSTTATTTTTQQPTTKARTTTVTSDPGILCFHHCTVKVFCFNLPNVCPNCNCEMDRTMPKFMPFRLPYPFIRASQYPCGIVLRPTTGDFLNDYNNSMDLHIGVTTSHGSIVEFDRNGLQRRSDNNAWWQCLLVGDVPDPWHDLWDDVLMQICKQPHWTIDHYNEETYNCYTFVLKFLEALGYAGLSEAAQSKTVFCEKYIVPRTTTAGKYISLYRKLMESGLYMHNVKDGNGGGGNTGTLNGKNMERHQKLFPIAE